MTDWAKGYAAALADLRHLATLRSLMSHRLAELIDDLTQDARVIDHEITNRGQRRELAARREAQEELPLCSDSSC
jgi:predicted NUDIX family NTP pyrophosphohydrolase